MQSGPTSIDVQKAPHFITKYFNFFNIKVNIKWYLFMNFFFPFHNFGALKYWNDKF